MEADQNTTEGSIKQVSAKEARRAAKQHLKETKIAYKQARIAAGKSPTAYVVAIIILAFACAIGGAAAMWYYMDGKHQIEIASIQEKNAQLAQEAAEKAEAEKQKAVEEAAKNAAAEQRAKDKQEAADKNKQQEKRTSESIDASTNTDVHENVRESSSRSSSASTSSAPKQRTI